MANEMGQPVIPYATPSPSGIRPRDVFGVIVRTIGLLMIVCGLYCGLYWFNVQTTLAPMTRHDLETLGYCSIFLLVMGLSFLKCEWLLRFTYGPDLR